MDLAQPLTLSSWLHVRDIEPLSPKQIEEFLAQGHRRASGDLKLGYEIAQDPTSWSEEQKEIAKELEKSANQVDELEDDDEEEADTSTTKRKKATKEKSKKKAKVAKVSSEFSRIWTNLIRNVDYGGWSRGLEGFDTSRFPRNWA